MLTTATRRELNKVLMEGKPPKSKSAKRVITGIILSVWSGIAVLGVLAVNQQRAGTEFVSACQDRGGDVVRVVAQRSILCLNESGRLILPNE